MLIFVVFVECVNQHCFNNAGMVDSLLLVTASVDKMVIKKPILVDSDLKTVGAVTWVGRSSMEIQLEVIQSTEGTVELITLIGCLDCIVYYGLRSQYRFLMLV